MKEVFRTHRKEEEYGVKVKQHKGAWWVFIDHKGKRKAKKIGASK